MWLYFSFTGFTAHPLRCLASCGLDATAAKQPTPLEAELNAAFKKGLALTNRARPPRRPPLRTRPPRWPRRCSARTTLTRLPSSTRWRPATSTWAAPRMPNRCWRSLAIREAKLGKDDPAVAQCLNNLAIVCHQLGRHKESETYFQRSLEIREAKLGKDHARCWTL